jgi:CRISPR-associated endonuclease Cas2
MSEPKTSQFILAYDLSSDRERRQVAKLLLGYGFRWQWSVFVCRLSDGQHKRLCQELTELALSTGFVLVTRIAHGSQLETIGHCTASDMDSDYAFIV